SLGAAQYARATLDRPLAGQRPLVEPQVLGHDVLARLVEPRTTRRREVLRLLVPEVRLGRPQARPVRLHLETFVGNGDRFARHLVRSRLPQQLLDDALALLVAALAEVVVPDPPLRVRDVDGGPIVVGERLPDAVLAVDRDRITDSVLLNRPADVVD